MSALYILISISISVAGLFLILFIWAIRSGQYDDTYGPSVRILFDKKTKDDGEKSKETLRRKTS